LATLVEHKTKTDGVINDLLGKHDVFANFPTGKVILGDCNKVLKDVFSRVKYEQYRRGLCLLDHYGIDLERLFLVVIPPTR
jgi:hypothetical protein